VSRRIQKVVAFPRRCTGYEQMETGNPRGNQQPVVAGE